MPTPQKKRSDSLLAPMHRSWHLKAVLTRRRSSRANTGWFIFTINVFAFCQIIIASVARHAANVVKGSRAELLAHSTNSSRRQTECKKRVIKWFVHAAARSFHFTKVSSHHTACASCRLLAERMYLLYSFNLPFPHRCTDKIVFHRAHFFELWIITISHSTFESLKHPSSKKKKRKYLSST